MSLDQRLTELLTARQNEFAEAAAGSVPPPPSGTYLALLLSADTRAVMNAQNEPVAVVNLTLRIVGDPAQEGYTWRESLWTSDPVGLRTIYSWAALVAGRPVPDLVKAVETIETGGGKMFQIVVTTSQSSRDPSKTYTNVTPRRLVES